MVKRLILLWLCVGGLLLPSWAQESPAFIEHVVLATTGAKLIWEYLPPDPTAFSSFKSPILLSFDVPPSQKSSAMFIEFWGQYIYSWTSNTNRFRELMMHYRLTSPIFPNIEIWQAYGVPPGFTETNNAGDQMYPPGYKNRVKGYCKMPLRRISHEWWNIYEINTHQYLFGNEALSIMSGFIDSGYKVEVWAEGNIQGLSYVAPFAFQVEVTRLAHR
jgi:hypothetical protein